MKMFGGGINHEFSEAEETCILINFDEIHEAKKERHIDSFIDEKVGHIKERFPLFFENMGENLKSMIAHKREEVQARRAARVQKRKARRAARKQKK
jgi:hypothetical protein